ncbi:DUF5107 domain-containing protein [Kineosporia babensis]|uniref:DUF5107 domain-containing protein n=1 Tax=Kineosporia babensis TaxID=499548 RepID=A0A9X1SVW0_9ACTN|nr:DUF5107 domain-containing protein [Kineosporia babensis]MCD5314079.1 DUF5107 domain-containing protein [Kineosporia babensis]
MSSEPISRIELPDAPADAWQHGVAVWSEPLVIDSYLPEKPSAYPAFLHNRVYQGSSGRVFPLPFHERIAAVKRPHTWQALHLENEWLRVVILPELGGRVHIAYDKVAGYDLFYRNNVIKPALVGLAGPWMSGGIEFNWPQHHRPATFLPTDVEIEREDDGSATVWCSDHDPFARMKGMHGIRLTPSSSRIEARVRLYNRSEVPQTFLWWANVAAAVNDDYQSFFPGDVTHVADHAKRAVVTFPRPDAPYYGIDYAGATEDDPEADRLDWYRNIPVPTSYMALDTVEDFFGGYDHGVQAGFVHVAAHEISPGKKQWTWGDTPFGWAWDRNLTDTDGPYVELMAGVYTDNQPDFAHLAVGETKTFVQAWYPVHGTGPVQYADRRLALSVAENEGRLWVRLCAAEILDAVSVVITDGTFELGSRTLDLRPGQTCELEVGKTAKLTVRITRPGETLADFTLGEPSVPDQAPTTTRAVAPPSPADVTSIDELIHIARYLDQYRHATRSSVPYLYEVLHREPGESRALLALGAKAYERGDYATAADLLRRSADAQTRWSPTPASGEALYRLGLALTRLGRDGEAATALARAGWDARFAVTARFALARLRCRHGDHRRAGELLHEVLDLDAHHLQAADLLATVLAETGDQEKARTLARTTLERDPLDAWARDLAGLAPTADATSMLDVALEYAAAGFDGHAIAALNKAETLAATSPSGQVNVTPLVQLHRAVLHLRAGETELARADIDLAGQQDPASAHPLRLDDIDTLRTVTATAPEVALPWAMLGHWYYSRDRAEDAIEAWHKAAAAHPATELAAIVHRNLGLSAYNVRADVEAAVQHYESALQASPDDAKLWFERDQLAARAGENSADRLARLEPRRDLVAERDDLTVSLTHLLLDEGRVDEARTLLTERHFQPWEGGEGLALGAWERSSVRMAQRLLADGQPREAAAVVRKALQPPAGLGEDRHHLANTAELYLLLGDALAADADPIAAQRCWEIAARSTGDFVDMAATAFNRNTVHAVRALACLGREDEAENLVKALAQWVEEYAVTPVEVDFFATSLPSMLLFVESPETARNREVSIVRDQIRGWQS